MNKYIVFSIGVLLSLDCFAKTHQWIEQNGVVVCQELGDPPISVGGPESFPPECWEDVCCVKDSLTQTCGSEIRSITNNLTLALSSATPKHIPECILNSSEVHHSTSFVSTSCTRPSLSIPSENVITLNQDIINTLSPLMGSHSPHGSPKNSPRFPSMPSMALGSPKRPGNLNLNASHIASPSSQSESPKGLSSPAHETGIAILEDSDDEAAEHEAKNDAKNETESNLKNESKAEEVEGILIGKGNDKLVYKKYDPTKREYYATYFVSTEKPSYQRARYEAEILQGLTGEQGKKHRIAQSRGIRNETNSHGSGFRHDVELFEKGDLRHQLQNKALSVDEIMRLAGDTCSAVTYLHSQGIVHRDIKGGNIFLDSDGGYRLNDFGLSYRLNDVLSYDSRTDGRYTDSERAAKRAIEKNNSTVIFSLPRYLFGEKRQQLGVQTLFKLDRDNDEWEFGTTLLYAIRGGDLPWFQKGDEKAGDLGIVNSFVKLNDAKMKKYVEEALNKLFSNTDSSFRDPLEKIMKYALKTGVHGETFGSLCEKLPYSSGKVGNATHPFSFDKKRKRSNSELYPSDDSKEGKSIIRLAPVKEVDEE